MNILGINAFHGDASAALVVDGRLVIAVEEERFRRIKHCAGFPSQAIRACLDHAKLGADEVDLFAVSRNSRAHLWRKLWFAARNRPSLALVTDRWRNRSRITAIDEILGAELGLPVSDVSERLRRVEHHPAHLASAFYPSPFDRAAVCAIDGFGDFVSTSTAIGRGDSLAVERRVYFPHSLGLLYLAVTQHLGFHNYGDEYKVMGLAPYGAAEFVDSIRRLVHLEDDGQFRLALEYFRHGRAGVEMDWDEGAPSVGPVFTSKLEELLGPARKADERLAPRHEAIAHSLQLVYEESVFHVLRALQRRTSLTRLCLAGGCAMNSVANGKIRQQTGFDEIYVQPASGDDGTALGAALHVHHSLGEPRVFTMSHGYWGTGFNDREIGRTLTERADDLAGVSTVLSPVPTDELVDWTADKIASGCIVGWFQGRMEWGSRALGNRSILADPRREDMRDIINSKIKFREKFRPFAPSVLEESRDRYFEGAADDPFMLQVYPVRAERRSQIPAVTHVDGSGRLQSVGRATNPLFWELLTAFERATGVPVLLNTSFNENEPIVQAPREAIDCFVRTDMDILVIGGFRLVKQRLAETPDAESCEHPQRLVRQVG